MTKLFSYLLFCSGLLLSCLNNHREKKSGLADSTRSAVILKNDHNFPKTYFNYFILGKDSVTVLPFEIQISLSPIAKEKITNSNETIIISVSLTGTPNDTTLYAEDGQFYVASSEKEITYGQVARFDNIRIPKTTFDQLTNKDVYVTAFVYSGRKSSADNLLNCDILADSLSNVVYKTFTINGKLIYGDN